MDPRVFSEIQERFKRDRDASLDEIKKLNEVAYLPTTYHSCGAVLILTDDDVSNASAIKTFFTDLDSKSDVTEILIQDIPSFRHLNEEINVLILEISARFGNLLEGETQRQTEKSLSLCLSRLKNTLLVLKRRTRQGRREVQDDILRLTHLMHGIVSILRMELKQRDELKSFLQSTMVTAEWIQAKLTELIQSPEWFVIERKEKEENFRENMSAVINRWIHRQG